MPRQCLPSRGYKPTKPEPTRKTPFYQANYGLPGIHSYCFWFGSRSQMVTSSCSLRTTSRHEIETGLRAVHAHSLHRTTTTTAAAV